MRFSCSQNTSSSDFPAAAYLKPFTRKNELLTGKVTQDYSLDKLVGCEARRLFPNHNYPNRALQIIGDSPVYNLLQSGRYLSIILRKADCQLTIGFSFFRGINYEKATHYSGFQNHAT